MSRSLAASTELALRLAKSEVRGGELALVLTHDWLDRNKRHGELTAVEQRVKQACWDWFRELDVAALERVSPARRPGEDRLHGAPTGAGATPEAPARATPASSRSAPRRAAPPRVALP